MTPNQTNYILIVGGGVVGAATAKALLKFGNIVHIVDSDLERVLELEAQGIWASQKPLTGSHYRLVLICVPTPADSAGYDLTFLDRACKSLAESVRLGEVVADVVCIRSTVPPGTTNKLVRPIFEDLAVDLAAFPEFLRQNFAEMDALNPRAQVVGATSENARAAIREIMSPIGGTFIEFDNPTSAELAKCTHNAFNAAKISFFNEVASIAIHNNVDADAIAAAVITTAEGSWNPLYGIKSGQPFGGLCLPKDLDGLIGYGSNNELKLEILNAIRSVNQSFTYATESMKNG